MCRIVNNSFSSLIKVLSILLVKESNLEKEKNGFFITIVSISS